MGGRDVDFMEDPYLQAIANIGVPFTDTRVRIKRGRPNECHRNAALFWLKGQCDAIAIGYYLGPDDIWRQHSWGVMGDCTILDTHAAGRMYFGIRLDSMAAVKFAEDHVGIVEVLRCMRASPERFSPIIRDARRSLADAQAGLGERQQP
jgi:hypothetical protein